MRKRLLETMDCNWIHKNSHPLIKLSRYACFNNMIDNFHVSNQFHKPFANVVNLITIQASKDVTERLLAPPFGKCKFQAYH